MTRLRAELAAVAAALALLFTLVPVASGAQQATGSLDLQSITTFRTPDQPLTYGVRVRSSLPAANLELAVGIYRRVGTRLEFADTVEGKFRTRSPIELLRVPLGTIGADADGTLLVAVTPTTNREGVYPTRVELRATDSGDVLDSFVTHVVNLPATIDADPLSVALVLPLHAPPAVQPTGQTDLDTRRAGAFADLAASIEAHAALPLTLAPTGETVEALEVSPRGADRETLNALARALPDRSAVVPGTYVPVDMRALLDAGLAGEAAALVKRSRETSTRALAVTPSNDVRIIDEALDQDALGALGDQGVSRLVVAENALEPHTLRKTLTASFVVNAPGGPVPAVVADGALRTHVTRDTSAVLRAGYLLADLAVLWFDNPSRAAARRGVVLEPPRQWVPDAALIEPLLDGLGSTPILEPLTIDAFFEAVGPQRAQGRTMVRRFVAPADDNVVNGSAVRAARNRIEAFASAVTADNPALDRLDRTLLASMSSDLRARTRSAYLTGVHDQIRGQVARVEMPRNRSITLTAREGEIPITVTKRLPYPMHVVVELSSDTLEFPGDATRTIELARENTTERFAVHAGSSGSFPVRVRMRSPEGGLVLAETRFTVRSTAVSGVGVALSVGAAAFLLFWWASHLRSTRRAGRAERAERAAAVTTEQSQTT